jgi:hypothetical protein
MNLPIKAPILALQFLEPEPDAVYTIEAAAHLAQRAAAGYLQILTNCVRTGCQSPKKGAATR